MSKNRHVLVTEPWAPFVKIQVSNRFGNMWYIHQKLSCYLCHLSKHEYEAFNKHKIFFFNFYFSPSYLILFVRPGELGVTLIHTNMPQTGWGRHFTLLISVLRNQAARKKERKIQKKKKKYKLPLRNHPCINWMG